jgi:DNA mismatch repair protein MutS
MSSSQTPSADSKVTPMLRQYNAIKAQYPNYILMFRMGDFYEMFGDDAVVASKVLSITLTKRPWGDGRNMPLAGVPYHAVDAYLAKFIRAGKKVAICDQMEDPKKTTKLVKREVTRVVTPGTILESDILDEKAHNFLASTCRTREGWGLAVTDLSTGSFEIAEFRGPESARQVFSEIGRLQPAEVLLPNELRHHDDEWLDPTLKTTLTYLSDDEYALGSARRRLLEQFEVQSLEGYGAERMSAAISAAGALVQYLRDTQLAALRHIKQLSVYNPSDFVVLDYTTQRSLELVRSIHDGSRNATLLNVLDRTSTAMGGRLMQSWLLQPLKDVSQIRERLDAVEEFYKTPTLRSGAVERLRAIYDLERIVSRVGLSAASPRDLASLRASLEQVQPIVDALATAMSPLATRLRDALDPHPVLLDLLRRALSDNPPFALRDGGAIRDGFDSDLDELRSVSTDTSAWMNKMRDEEIARTGIQNLKIGYNRVFGYFIEISKSNINAVPDTYIRKQTLVNGERYITPELKEKEEIILGAQERIAEIESRRFEELREEAASHTRSIQRLAACIGHLDVLVGLAEAAIAGNFVKPEVDEGDGIEIRDGRHPVIEALQTDRPFVPNDLAISNREGQIQIITGPNMAGKSTFIRQAALLTVMAHVGSFVPARFARFGAVDRIFTRVGAMDYLVRGQSTFLVEMSETANILNNATDRSLVILDEIGRGTSTYDGLSIAWAVVEYLHGTEGRRPKTLFATHYHELTDLEQSLSRVKNFNVAVLEKNEEITFLYKIVPGSTDHSYGIYAAKLAGVPATAIDRAKTILFQLECGQHPNAAQTTPDRRDKVEAEDGMVQLSLFDGLTHPVLERLRQLDANTLTPLQALEILSDLIEQAK